MFDCAQPDDYCLQEVVVHVASYHLDRDKNQEFNEFNPGIGLLFRVPGHGFFAAAGIYENSLYRPSAYAGVGKDFPIAGPMAFRLTGALVTGYSYPVIPVILPELTFRAGGYGLAIGYVPELSFGGAVVESFFSFSLLKKF
jgi:hypothetical protein